MQQVSAGTALVPFHRPRIGDYRKPKQVDLAAMEEALRKGLEGKFFNVQGSDQNEIDLNEDRRRETQRLLREAQKAKAGESLRRRLEARKAAREQFAAQRQKAMTYSTVMVIEAICHAHEIGASELLSSSRFKRVIRARQHACWLMRKLCGKSSTHIGEVLGRDHSTVIHAFGEWEKNASKHPREVAIVNDLLGVQA